MVHCTSLQTNVSNLKSNSKKLQIYNQYGQPIHWVARKLKLSSRSILIFLLCPLSSHGSTWPGEPLLLLLWPIRGGRKCGDICQWRTHNENINCTHKIRVPGDLQPAAACYRQPQVRAIKSSRGNNTSHLTSFLDSILFHYLEFLDLTESFLQMITWFRV